MIDSIRVRAWHVIAVLAVASAGVALVLGFGAAQTSGTPVNAGVPLAAPLQEPIPAYPSYIGWGYVSAGSSSYGRLMARSVTAWYWNGRSWVQRSRTSGTRVYIYPYASGWSWTWTQSTGWLAMRTNTLSIGYRPIAIAT